MGVEGTFDTLNPFSFKGRAPQELLSLVFQTLGQSTLDEIGASYPQVAEDFVLAPDRKSMRVKLYKSAKFSDGHPLSSEDVVFSLNILKSKEADPHYASYWSDIREVKALSPQELLFTFVRYTQEIPLLVSEIPVLPKHIYEGAGFSKVFLSRAVGSGPYIVENYKFASTIRFKKNPHFWAKDQFMNRGRFNFEHIVLDYYRDQVPLVQAFKNGSSNFFIAYFIKTWLRDLVGKAFDSKRIIKEEWKQAMNQGASGYFLNLSKPQFQDIRVRKAMILAFDFSWTNRTLFNDLYLQSESLFENSVYKAQGVPNAKETAILSSLKKKFPSDIPTEVFEKPVAYLGKGLNREERLKVARSLLKEAGYSLQKAKLTGPGGILNFNLLLRSPSALRAAQAYEQNLARIGIHLHSEVKDTPGFMHKLISRDFDLAALTVPASPSPGQEQVDFWHSHSAAETHSRNFYSLANPAVDALLERLIASQTGEERELNARCLDRLIYHLHIAVPNWYTDKYRVAYWNTVERPEHLPSYYFETQMIEFMYMSSQTP